MSRLVKHLELQQTVNDTWLGPASGPAGKRAFGGHLAAQSLSAACHTVDRARMPASMHLQFLRGGEAAQPVEYAVVRVFDGRTTATRRVDARQDGRLLTTATVSFAADGKGPACQLNGRDQRGSCGSAFHDSILYARWSASRMMPCAAMRTIGAPPLG
jgi:acyl-CoA thioesterase-2